MNTPLTIAPALALATLPPILPEGASSASDARKIIEINACPTDSTGPLFFRTHDTFHNDDIAAKPIPRRSQRASYIRRKGRK